MSHHQPHSATLEALNPISLEYALLAPDVVAWRLNLDTGALQFSKEFPLVFLVNLVLPDHLHGADQTSLLVLYFEDLTVSALPDSR